MPTLLGLIQDIYPELLFSNLAKNCALKLKDTFVQFNGIYTITIMDVVVGIG